uniref:Ubiquitin-like protease family profile domain-containing protein n=1 Tax=Ditylenchus dipsaci TaxID=166011 RepID=A0A915ENU8_9BILA
MLNWTRKLDLFDCDFLLIPIHSPGHWSLAVVNIQKGRLEYYDSLNGIGKTVLNNIRIFLIRRMASIVVSSVASMQFVCLKTSSSISPGRHGMGSLTEKRSQKEKINSDQRIKSLLDISECFHKAN